MTQKAISEITARLNAIDVRLGKGSTHFKWLIGLWMVQMAFLIAALFS